MISSVFGKTKPINHIIVFSFLFVFYWGASIFLSKTSHSPEDFFYKAIILVVLLFSIYLIKFIIEKNKMTKQNSFAIFFYALLIVVFPETLSDDNPILCSFFLLLSHRRLISMRSLKDIKSKIFDATVWVMISSLFYDWALLYLLMVFAAVYIYERDNIRNWLVPLVGIVTFFIVMYSLLILTGNKVFLESHYQFLIAIDFTYFINWGKGVKLLSYIGLVLFAGIYSSIKLNKSGLGKIVTMRLIVLSFCLGLILELLVPPSQGHPIIITFFPSVIFLTNYIESISKPNIREVVLILALFIPFFILALNSIVG